jgi:hypothetical protein
MTDPAPLTPNQIKYFASKQGFTGNDLNIAVAVALAESGGRPRAHNGVPPDDSYGLWQINMIGALGPARRKAFGIPTNETLYDPNVNAKAAYIVWKGSGGWKNWSTYTSGAYKRFMTTAEKATPTNTAGRNPADEATAIAAVDDSVVADPEAKAIFGAVNGLGTNIFNAMAGIGGVIAALVLLALGVIILARKPLKSGIGVVAGVTSPASKLGSAARIAKKVTT